MLGHAVRRFATSAVRSTHYPEGPGNNLPFSIENKWALLIKISLFFGSGFAVPFLLVDVILDTTSDWDATMLL
ncbi:hypothetical protein DNTS_006424 [Danionella cerebrum]|uniref:Cytochrome c oxidase subunit 7C, mitochondrial n=1 Tax=Danionella cerebrum TaxID=2873325 RepID=A0A553NLG1_9TELE|nr:hypothetical protein DNTS_006424 [Danionella translucida]